MKTAFFLLICFSIIFSAPKCFDEYAGIASKVETQYLSARAAYAQSNPTKQYVYEFFPTCAFPFFCLPADTVKKILPSNTETIYLCDYSVTISKYTDNNLKEIHVQIAVLNYIHSQQEIPTTKTYTLFFFVRNFVTGRWEEERRPISLVFVLIDYKNIIYKCR